MIARLQIPIGDKTELQVSIGEMRRLIERLEQVVWSTPADAAASVLAHHEVSTANRRLRDRDVTA